MQSPPTGQSSEGLAERLSSPSSLLLSFDLVFSLSLAPPAGLRRLHLHLLRPGDGGEDGGPGHLRPPLLPGRHLEPLGLLHRHGRVSRRPVSR